MRPPWILRFFYWLIIVQIMVFLAMIGTVYEVLAGAN